MGKEIRIGRSPLTPTMYYPTLSCAPSIIAWLAFKSQSWPLGRSLSVDTRSHERKRLWVRQGGAEFALGVNVASHVIMNVRQNSAHPPHIETGLKINEQHRYVFRCVRIRRQHSFSSIPNGRGGGHDEILLASGWGSVWWTTMITSCLHRR